MKQKPTFLIAVPALELPSAGAANLLMDAPRIIQREIEARGGVCETNDVVVILGSADTVGYPVPPYRRADDDLASDAMPAAPAEFVKKVIDAAPGKSQTARLRWCVSESGISRATWFNWLKTGLSGNTPADKNKAFFELAERLKVL